MISRVNSENKESRPKEKSIKKQRLNRKKKEKKNGTKKHKTSSPGVEPGSSACASECLYPAIQ